MDGGPSHYETFDPKPEAAEIRWFSTISTGTPGIQFSQLMTNLAGMTDDLAIVRSIRHDQNHGAKSLHDDRQPYHSVGCGH